MRLNNLLPGYQPMKRRQLWLTMLVILLALTGVGLIFLLCIDYHVTRAGQRLLKKNSVASPSERSDCVIVPGAPYFTDGSPGLMLKDRLDSALMIVRSGQTGRILISGDHGSDDYDEIGVMYRYLLDHGAAPEQICCDPAGFDTYETLVRAQKIFLVRRAIVTTQTYHLLRALYIGEHLNLNLHGIACDSRRYPQGTQHRIREVIARFKAWLDCEILHAEPMVGGKVTPINGNDSGNCAALYVNDDD